MTQETGWSHRDYLLQSAIPSAECCLVHFMLDKKKVGKELTILR